MEAEITENDGRELIKTLPLFQFSFPNHFFLNSSILFLFCFLGSSLCRPSARYSISTTSKVLHRLDGGVRLAALGSWLPAFAALLLILLSFNIVFY